jgi:hypothetical protein
VPFVIWRLHLALQYGDMASDTATIRVSRDTRDRLAARAHERGVSVASLLTEFARRAERADAVRSEREATQAEVDARDPLAEERLWESVLGDGLD